MKQAARGAPLVHLIRHLGFAQPTFYRWKRCDIGLESEQVREFTQLLEENAKLNRLVADLSLDKACSKVCSQNNAKPLAAAHGRAVSRAGLSDQRTPRLPNDSLRDG
jgi:hypothetical protein